MTWWVTGVGEMQFATGWESRLVEIEVVAPHGGRAVVPVAHRSPWRGPMIILVVHDPHSRHQRSGGGDTIDVTVNLRNSPEPLPLE